MKKLSIFKFKDTESLSAKEMQSVVGGADPSGWCYNGELLFTCNILWKATEDYPCDCSPSDEYECEHSSSAVTQGRVCAANATSAEEKVKQALRDQGTFDETMHVVCF